MQRLVQSFKPDSIGSKDLGLRLSELDSEISKKDLDKIVPLLNYSDLTIKDLDLLSSKMDSDSLINHSLLIKGNQKMGDKVLLYNLPGKLTCTPTKWCLEGRSGKPACYALRNNFRLLSAKKGAIIRYAVSKRNDFADIILPKLLRKKQLYFRWHASGDFYSEEYIKKVKNIAEECGNILFRTTTHRRDFTKEMQELNSLDNFVVRESLERSRPLPEMGLPFVGLESLEITKQGLSDGSVHMCPEFCDACGYQCWHGDKSTAVQEL
ncbi:MAG: hypothetical protein GOU97_04720 [Nanoarchaeota archaeon]|nr:hypothetical protein [Nanoarchaeota archaeon]